MRRIITLAVALVASMLAVLVPATPAQAAADCSFHTTPWTTYFDDGPYWEAGYVAPRAQVDYRFCVGDSSSWYKVVNLRGKYVTSDRNIDCGDNLGHDFEGVHFDWKYYLMSPGGGFDPGVKTVPCRADGDHVVTWDVEASTIRVDSRDVHWIPWQVEMCANITGANNPCWTRGGQL